MHVQNLVRDLIPREWKSIPVLISGYQVLFSKDNPPSGGLDILGTQCWFISGSLKYYHVERIRFGDLNTAKYSGGMEVRNTPEGIWLLTLTPMSGGDQRSAENRILSAIGLIAAWGGRNATYDKYFDFIYRYNKNEASVWSPIIINPASLKSPDLSSSPTLLALAKGCEVLGEKEKARVHLSLRWFAESFYRFGTDAFLSLWVAFEVLTMPDTNVKHANKLLSGAYRMPIAEVARRFMVGKLQGFRSDIIHGGKKDPIHHVLLDYLESLYVDCLYYTLGGSILRLADELVRKQGTEIQRVFKSI